jgi:hypothetical protein
MNDPVQVVSDPVPAGVPATDARPPVSRLWWRRAVRATRCLLLNLQQGLSAFWLLRRRPTRVACTSTGQFVALTACVVMTGLVYDFPQTGWQGGRLNLQALPYQVFSSVVMGLGSVALARLAGRPRRAATLIALGLAVLFWQGLASILLALAADWDGFVDQYYTFLSWLPFLWGSVAFALIVRRLLPVRRWWRRVLLLWLAVFVLVAPQWTIDPNARLWMPVSAVGRDDVGTDVPQSEASLYGQMTLLGDALDAIADGEAGTTELFTITLGGDGTRDVFFNEANSVDAKLANVFGSAEHSLVLANSQTHLLERPYASVSALQRGLATVAERMDVNDDVLALVISSYGTPDHHLLVSMPPYTFEDLTPQGLRGLLDASGIRYRVIILSGCYTGGFLDALTSDDTLVITASAADRMSFNCRGGDKWTDFGQAFFAEGLGQTSSFEDAFRIASQHIADRESRQGLTPSQPQMRMGRTIREQLKHLETRHGGRILYASASTLSGPNPLSPYPLF